MHEWGFSRLQNQGCRFLQHAEIFSHHEKFLKPISWTFQKLWISNVVSKNEFWQRWQKFLGCKKIFSSCKNFCMMLQKSLFAAQKDQASRSIWRGVTLTSSSFVAPWVIMMHINAFETPDQERIAVYLVKSMEVFLRYVTCAQD